MDEWQFIGPPSDDKVGALTRAFGIEPLIARVLVNRGYDEERSVRTFLAPSLKDLPSPLLLKDLARAVARIMSAIELGEKICIYGDYDVDGTVATSILWLFFREIGYDVDYYIPDRLKEGYSLNRGALDVIKQRGAKVIITVDNGITAHDAAQYARTLDLDLIITDHHQVPANLPEAFAVLNPHRSDCEFPDKGICGAGVAFYLAMGLRQSLRERLFFNADRPEPNLKKFLDLVAVATVADMMPLKGVNRIFVKLGLDGLNGSTWPGLTALKEVSGIEGRVRASHLGFRIGPRLNAGGRLAHADLGVACLTAMDPNVARKWAQELDTLNRERQRVEEQIKEQACALVGALPDRESIMGYVLCDPAWHAGVIGIVASRVVEVFYRPTVLLTEDGGILKGSARSCAGINLLKVLDACSDLLVRYGGHRQAAGLALERSALDQFRQRFHETIYAELKGLPPERVLHIDGELDLAGLQGKFFQQLSALEPFGMGNPEPVFILKDVEPVGLRLIGVKHLKFFAKKGQHQSEVVAFGRGEDLSGLRKRSTIDLAGVLHEDDYWEMPRLVIHARAWR